MKKLIGLILLGLIAFYGLWPAYSGYQINTALQNKDAALLERKIDFAAVRESLRPAVTVEVGRQLDAAGNSGGGLGGLLGGELKKQLLPQLVDGALTAFLTPANVIRIYTEGGDMKSAIDKIMRERMPQAGAASGAAAGGATALPGGLSLPGGLQLPGGLGQLGDLAGKIGGAKPADPATPATPAPTPAAGAKPSYGIANIKRLALAGPLGFEVGVAKDAAAAKPDLTAGMSFSGFDWKLTKLVPNL